MNFSTHTTRSIRPILGLLTVLLLGLPVAVQADYRILHHFTGGANDGATPYGSLIGSGSTLYGMTFEGGGGNLGTVFRMNTDGSGFQLLHTFISDSVDGTLPIGSLLLSGSTLYGMASSRGSSYGGTIFKLNTDGTDFQVLRSFAVGDGQWPWASLIQSGSILYGMNTYGGSAGGWDGKGAIFKINTDGSSFQKLHTFAGGGSDGAGPHDSLIQSGTTLYGTTQVGGGNNYGTIFRINTDGTGFGLLHSFTGGSNDGSYPAMNALILSGSTIYGATYSGGSSSNGTVFKMNADGTGFTVLHSFTGSDGQYPAGGPTLSGSMLHGTTTAGGDSNLGVIFQINTDGTGYQVLHTFNGTDGSAPYRSLFMSGSTLYGMANGGGSHNQGVIFAVDVPTADPNGPVFNLSTGQRFISIQTAINLAEYDQVILLSPGTYKENLTLPNIPLTIRSTNAQDSAVVSMTTLVGNGSLPVVTLKPGTALRSLQGLTIRGGADGIVCSGAELQLSSCVITGHRDCGIEVSEESTLSLDHCIVAGNGGAGLRSLPKTGGRRVLFSKVDLTHCTITENRGCALDGDGITVTNSILYGNGVSAGGGQIKSSNVTVSYCDVQGGGAGQGNLDADPAFVACGTWGDPDTYTPGDFHLRSGAGHWNPGTGAWVLDDTASPCIDAGNPNSAFDLEPSPNGARVNVGAYGNTGEASKSATNLP